ncbi:MAG: hypothetical protein ABUS56_10705, partial [Acidobacteriota bacterium]
MLKLLERNIRVIGQRLVLVAPASTAPPNTFVNIAVDTARHDQLVRRMQAFRGAIYLQEGNVKRHQLTVDGRHQTPEDDKSWHLLMVDPGGQISSCAWYRNHDDPKSIDDLRIRTCPLMGLDEWRGKLAGAVESEITRAREAGLRYAELGGWAILGERRGTPEELMMALATYSLSRVLGGALGITTANVAHSCSSILRRFGGSHLEFEGTAIPPYFDPQYNTNIELLRFDSRSPNTKYVGLIDIVKEQLVNASVIASPLEIGRAEPRPAARRVSRAAY